MTEQQKKDLIEEANRRFPSGCSYYTLSGNGESTRELYKEVNNEGAYWYSPTSIAIGPGKGLVYCHGNWAKRTDIKESSEYSIF